MKHMRLILPLIAALLAQPAAAACYADYKAKRDNPLRLHYGVVELRGGCNKASARSELAGRLDRAGWRLLNVLAVFGPEGLDQRKKSAGKFFLRF